MITNEKLKKRSNIIMIQVTPTHIVVTTKTSKRTDTGPYKINVSNRHGKDTAKLNVTVLDVPGKPTGPITATDVCGDVSAWILITVYFYEENQKITLSALSEKNTQKQSQMFLSFVSLMLRKK